MNRIRSGARRVAVHPKKYSQPSSDQSSHGRKIADRGQLVDARLEHESSLQRVGWMVKIHKIPCFLFSFLSFSISNFSFSLVIFFVGFILLVDRNMIVFSLRKKKDAHVWKKDSEKKCEMLN